LQKRASLNDSITLRHQKHCFQTLCSDCPTIISLRRRFDAGTRRGALWQQSAVNGRKRCRMHGGAEGSGAPKGNQNALKHGRYTAEAVARRREVAALLCACRDWLGGMRDR
jgi:hypothetical protein